VDRSDLICPFLNQALPSKRTSVFLLHCDENDANAAVKERLSSCKSHQSLRRAIDSICPVGKSVCVIYTINEMLFMSFN
jgi:hypothetical protein